MCEFVRAEEELAVVMTDTADHFDFDEERRGGPQDDDDEEKRRMEERERKKAEVRARLAEQSAKKSKKGFLTPERKKKLRKLLMLKAAEDLKQQQLLKEQERKRVLDERCPSMPDIEDVDDTDKLMRIADELHKKLCEVMETKYDIEMTVKSKDHEINELMIEVNNLRGKFVKPPLKKVSKYDNKFKATNQSDSKNVDFRGNLKETKKRDAFLDELKQAAENDGNEFAQMADDAAVKKKVDLRQGLKQVEKKEFTLEDLDKDKEDKPQWADKPLADADERADEPAAEEAEAVEEAEEE